MPANVILLLVLMLTPITSFAFGELACKDTDTTCRSFQTLADAEQYEKIIGKIDPSKQYSEETRHYIGTAYLALAGREDNTPQQEEQYCRKAIEYGLKQAYMGLYFIHAQDDPDRAIAYLTEYVLTGPNDSVPYVILGEYEMEKKNYKAADILLREAKRVARAHSPRVDWLLFQVNYHLKDYSFAGEMLSSALENGKFNAELKAILADEHYKGIEKRPEFRKYRDVLKEAKKHS